MADVAEALKGELVRVEGVEDGDGDLDVDDGFGGEAGD